MPELLRDNLHTTKCTHFTCAFNKVLTKVYTCETTTIRYRTFLSPPKVPLCPFAVNPLSSLHTSGHHLSNLFSQTFSPPRILCKRNHTVYCHFCPVFSQLSKCLGSIHVAECFSSLFLLLLSSIPLYQVLATMNKAATYTYTDLSGDIRFYFS